MTTHLEIDVSKATSKNADNPIYYVQYAHARINQLQEKAHYKLPKNFNLLTSVAEKEIINQLQMFKPTIVMIAKNNEVHRLPTYLVNLAKLYHAYYTNNKIIDSNNEELSAQRY